MKHFKHFLLAVLVALTSSVTASAYDFEVDGIYYNILSQDDLTCEVTKSDNKYSGDIAIPSTVTYSENTFSVTSIGSSAFFSCYSLTSVVIPNSVISIGEWAFSGCSNLTSVEIPNSVTSIGYGAFESCYLLKSFTGKFASEDSRCLIVDGILTAVAPADLTSYCIPNSVTSIGNWAVSCCYSLTSLEIPNSVKTIGDYAFFNSNRLTSVKIPSSVTSIGNSAFGDCTSLTSVTVYNNNPADINLESPIFCNFTSPCTLYVPKGSKDLYAAVEQWNATNIEEFSISSEDNTVILYTSSDGKVVELNRTDVFGANFLSNTYEDGQGKIAFDGEVTSIGDGAFLDRSSLTSVVIPNSVTSIGCETFMGCSSLTSVTIPNSVTEISKYAFTRCSSLTSFTGKFASSDNRCLIIDGVLNYFAPAGLTSYEIPNSVTSIGSSAFYECSSLTSVEIPNTVTAIGWSAFSGCSGLTSVEIPNSVTSIESDAFSGCTSLPVEGNLRYADTYLVGVADKTISTNAIKEGTKWIGSSAFSGCTNLTSVNIPTSVTEIGICSFYGCTCLASVDIPSSVTSIGSYAFYGCSGLTSVTVENSDPANITLTRTVFYNVPTSACTLYVPKGSKELYAAADQWKDFTNIEEISNSSEENNIIYYISFPSEGVVKPNKTDVFGANIISNDYNDGQGKIVFDGEVTSIGDLAFKSSFLTSVTIPNSVTTIGESAFNLCTMLTSVEIPGSVTSIGGSAFYYCKSLTSATIGNSVTSIGEGAFNSCFSLKSVTVENDNPANITLGSSVFEEVPTSTCTLYVPKGSRDLYAAADQWKDFSNIEEISNSSITLVDGEAYAGAENMVDVDITYTRNFTNTDWQSLYLPFDMSYDEWSPYVEVAELYNVRGYDNDSDGAIDEVLIDFNRLNSGSIKPNVPYIVRAKEAGEVTFSCTGKKLCAAPAEEGMVECSSTKFAYTIRGIYQPKTDVWATGAYFLAGGLFCQAADNTVTLTPYRSYLTITQKSGGYNSDAPAMSVAPKRIAISVDGEEATGIGDALATSPQADIYYNLDGRKVANPAKGIYIHNGKKIYVK